MSYFVFVTQKTTESERRRTRNEESWLVGNWSRCVCMFVGSESVWREWRIGWSGDAGVCQQWAATAAGRQHSWHVLLQGWGRRNSTVSRLSLLGRLFDRVILIKPVSNVRPSSISFFDFNEIWHVARGRWVMHDCMQYDPIHGQGHKPLKVGYPAIFEHYPFCHLQWELATDHGFLN